MNSYGTSRLNDRQLIIGLHGMKTLPNDRGEPCNSHRSRRDDETPDSGAKCGRGRRSHRCPSSMAAHGEVDFVIRTDSAPSRTSRDAVHLRRPSPHGQSLREPIRPQEYSQEPKCLARYARIATFPQFTNVCPTGLEPVAPCASGSPTRFFAVPSLRGDLPAIPAAGDNVHAKQLRREWRQS